MFEHFKGPARSGGPEQHPEHSEPAIMALLSLADDCIAGMPDSIREQIFQRLRNTEDLEAEERQFLEGLVERAELFRKDFRSLLPVAVKLEPESFEQVETELAKSRLRRNAPCN